MAKFPIEYAKRPPPAATPTVPAQLDVREGGVGLGQQISKAGSQLASFGMDLLDKIQKAADKIQKAADSTEMDTLTRKYLEERNAYVQFADTNADPKANAEALKAFQDRVQAFKPSRRVGPAWNHFLSTQVPNDVGKFQFWNLKKTRAQIEQDMKLNLESLLVSGDGQSYVEMLERQVSNGMISLETKQALMERFPADSAMAQVEMQAAKGDWKGYTATAATAGVLPLTSKQRNRLNYLTDLRDREVQSVNRKGLTAMYVEMAEKEKLTPQEKAALAPGMIQKVKELNLSPPEAASAIDRLTRWSKDETVRTDPGEYAKLVRSMRSLGPMASTEDVNHWYDSVLATGPISDTDRKSLLSRGATRIESSVNGVITQLIDLGTSANQIGKNDEADYTVALLKWIDEQEKPPSPNEIGEYGRQLLRSWKRRPETVTLMPTQQKRGELRGMIIAGGYISPFTRTFKPLKVPALIREFHLAGWHDWSDDPHVLGLLDAYHPGWKQKWMPNEAQRAALRRLGERQLPTKTTIPTGPKQMTVDLAKDYLKRAGNDRKKAEDMARADGYAW